MKTARERHSYYWKPKKKKLCLSPSNGCPQVRNKALTSVPKDPGTNEQAKKLKI